MRKIKRDLIGKNFGELTVIKFDNESTKKRRWIVKYNGYKCGKEYSLLEHHLIYGKITTCYNCVAKKRRLKNTISSAIWYRIKKRYKDNSIKISPLITKEYLWDLYIKQNKKCALSGIDIYLASSSVNKKENTASVDRIDSSKGYIPDNVQWVHKKINKMKLDYSQNYFIELCGLVAKNN